MMYLILVKREGLRRLEGGGDVYPVWRGQSEVGGGGKGHQGCPTFGGTRTGLRVLEDTGQGGAQSLRLPSALPPFG